LIERDTALPDASFALLAKYEERHFWFRARNEVIVWALRRYFPHLRTFLEIGCGTGVVLAAIRDAFPGAELTGSELSAAGLGFAARRVGGARLTKMDGRRIPYENAFDVVGAFDVLEHIEDDVAVLQQMRRAVVPGGGLIVSVPQHPWLWSGVDEYGGHFRRYARRELLAKICGAGFVVEHATSFMTLVLPAMMAARFTARSAASLDPAAELKVGSATNAALGLLCACEARAIVRGWSLPVGGSLLAVARRTA